MPQRAATSTRILAVLLAAVVVSTPVAAQAETFVHQDARGDMVVMSVSPREPRPDETKGDILRIRVRHTARRVQVRVLFADLVKSPDILYLTGVLFRTNEGVRRTIQVESRPENWRGFVRMYNQQGALVRCAVHRTHDFANNVALVGFPRRCLSNPRWIRVRLTVTTAVPVEYPMGIPPILEDDAFRTRIGPDIPSPISPRIRRG